MSTTTDKHEAMKYAMYSGAPVIFEVQQGMVAKGADISWLSQFPSEAEGNAKRVSMTAAMHADPSAYSGV